ncbi:MAG: ribonuclease P protein component [Verrucomicrobiaceae bacterium]|nr:ribonuclease P protein component [Verrucomicrobiaceae bacterium]
MRLPSSLRLKNASDFARVKAAGTSHAGKFIVLGAAKAENEPEFRYGLITGRKIGNAVVRNRIRRLLREVIRAHRPEIAPGWHFVVIGRWKAPQASLAEIETDWLRLAKRLGILQTASAA